VADAQCFEFLRGSSSLIKRLFDYLLTVPGLVVISPIIVLATALVRLKIGTPVLFTQVRPGLHGKAFRIYKFRTMTDAKDEDGNLLPDAERLVPFGRFLRSTSLDELPELIKDRKSVV